MEGRLFSPYTKREKKKKKGKKIERGLPALRGGPDYSKEASFLHLFPTQERRGGGKRKRPPTSSCKERKRRNEVAGVREGEGPITS